MQILVVGRIQTRNYDDDKGQKHYVTEVVAEEVYFGDSKKEGKEENTTKEVENNDIVSDNLDELPW